MGLSSWSLDHIAFSWRVIPKAFRIKDPWESWNYQIHLCAALCDDLLAAPLEHGGLAHPGRTIEEDEQGTGGLTDRLAQRLIHLLQARMRDRAGFKIGEPGGGS